MESNKTTVQGDSQHGLSRPEVLHFLIFEFVNIKIKENNLDAVHER